MNYLNNIQVDNCVGAVLQTKNSGEFKVVEYNHSKCVVISFVETGYRKVCDMKEVRTGSIKDLMKPSVYGKGIIGNKYSIRGSKKDQGKLAKEYELWSGMLERCYSERTKRLYPSYFDCKSSDNFQYYEYFHEWCNKQQGFAEGFDLDKDLLVKGNKLYSEDTCCFIPREINSALTKNNVKRGKLPIGVHYCNSKKCYVGQVCRNNGSQDYLGYFDNPTVAFNAYKVAKEDYLKSLAEKWKGKIDTRAYEALMNYQVEITD